jgi:hypothetical protein
MDPYLPAQYYPRNVILCQCRDVGLTSITGIPYYGFSGATTIHMRNFERQRVR